MSKKVHRESHLESCTKGYEDQSSFHPSPSPIKTWYQDRAEAFFFLAFWHNFVPLEATLGSFLVSFPITCWSSCRILCTCGTFLCLFSPSKRFRDIQGVSQQSKKHTPNGLTTCVLALQLVHGQNWKSTFLADPSPFLVQNGSPLRLSGTHRLSKQTKQTSKHAENTSTGTPSGPRSFLCKFTFDPFQARPVVLMMGSGRSTSDFSLVKPNPNLASQPSGSQQYQCLIHSQVHDPKLCFATGVGGGSDLDLDWDVCLIWTPTHPKSETEQRGGRLSIPVRWSHPRLLRPFTMRPTQHKWGRSGAGTGAVQVPRSNFRQNPPTQPKPPPPQPLT